MTETKFAPALYSEIPPWKARSGICSSRLPKTDFSALTRPSVLLLLNLEDFLLQIFEHG